jgi:hypothetical protein
MPINRAFPLFPQSDPVGILWEFGWNAVFTAILVMSTKWWWGNINALIASIGHHFIWNVASNKQSHQQLCESIVFPSLYVQRIAWTK